MQFISWIKMLQAFNFKYTVLVRVRRTKFCNIKVKLSHFRFWESNKMTEETANHQQWDSNRCTIKPERKAIVKLYRLRQHGVCIAINEGKRWRASGNADFHGTASRPVELDRKVWNWISRKHLRCDRILTGMQAGNESGKGFFLSRQNRYTWPWEIVNELPTFYRSNFFLHIFFLAVRFSLVLYLFLFCMQHGLYIFVSLKNTEFQFPSYDIQPFNTLSISVKRFETLYALQVSTKRLAIPLGFFFFFLSLSLFLPLSLFLSLSLPLCAPAWNAKFLCF